MFNLRVPKSLPGKALAVSTTAALALAGSLVATAPANAATVIEDDNLFACISSALNGATANSTNIGNLTGTLNCADRAITDLSGISLLKGLSGLDLSGNPISDLGDLGSLTKLVDLDLSDTGLDSIVPLGTLTNLLNLDLSGDDLTSVVPLASLTKLVDLDLGDNDLTSLLGLQGLTKLLDLDLSDNNITDLLPLQNLTQLLGLDLSGNGLTSLLGLQNLTGLLDLDLSDNLLSDLTNLPDLLHVLNLDLGNNLLTSVTGLLGLSHVTDLILSGNPLGDLTQLDQLQDVLTPVTQLDLDGILPAVNSLLTSLLGTGSPIEVLLGNLGVTLGSLNLDGLLGNLLGTGGIDLSGILDGLGLGDLIAGDTTVTVPPDTIIVNTPSGSAGTDGTNGSNGSNGANGSNGGTGGTGGTGTGTNGTNGSNGSTTPSDNAAITSAGTPTITGSKIYAQTLKVNPGAWDATTLTYQWFRGATAIPGATGTSYKLAVADVGTLVSVRVTGSKPGATSVTNASAPTTKIAAAKFKHTTQPTITGTLKSGKTLKAKTKGYSKTVKITYQWYRGSTKIKKATKTSYKLTAKDKGKKVVVKITIKKAGYTNLVRASKSKKIAK